ALWRSGLAHSPHALRRRRRLRGDPADGGCRSRTPAPGGAIAADRGDDAGVGAALSQRRVLAAAVAQFGVPVAVLRGRGAATNCKTLWIEQAARPGHFSFI